MREMQYRQKTTKYHRTDRRKKLIIGSTIVVILISIPFFFYSYRYAPIDSKVWPTWFLDIDSGNFRSAQAFIHHLFTKITFVVTFLIWYLTCKYWWKTALLVPFSMFMFQLTGILNYKYSVLDEYDFWYSLPIILPVIVLLYFIKRKLSFYTDTLDLKETIDNELEELKKELN